MLFSHGTKVWKASLTNVWRSRLRRAVFHISLFFFFPGLVPKGTPTVHGLQSFQSILTYIRGCKLSTCGTRMAPNSVIYSWYNKFKILFQLLWRKLNSIFLSF